MGSMTKYEENGQIRTYLKLVMVVGGERLGTGRGGQSRIYYLQPNLQLKIYILLYTRTASFTYRNLTLLSCKRLSAFIHRASLLLRKGIQTFSNKSNQFDDMA